MTDENISALERLAKLKTDGAISDTEYETQKARLMGGLKAMTKGPEVPVWRRLWVVVTLTVLLIPFPVALAILASGPVYRQVDGDLHPISKGARLTYSGFLALWLVALLAKAIFHPGHWGTDGNQASPKASMAAVTASGPAAASTQSPAKQASNAQPATETDPSKADDEKPQADQSSGTGDPLEGRYSEQFRQCMAGEDAAGGSTSAMMACTNQELNVQVAKLNETYKGLMTVLSEGQRDRLRADQAVFIRQLQTQCPEGDTEANGQLAMLDRPSCLLSKTIERAMALEKLQAQSGQQ